MLIEKKSGHFVFKVVLYKSFLGSSTNDKLVPSILLRIQNLYGKLNKCLWGQTRNPVFHTAYVITYLITRVKLHLRNRKFKLRPLVNKKLGRMITSVLKPTLQNDTLTYKIPSETDEHLLEAL